MRQIPGLHLVEAAPSIRHILCHYRNDEAEKSLQIAAPDEFPLTWPGPVAGALRAFHPQEKP